MSPCEPRSMSAPSSSSKSNATFVIWAKNAFTLGRSDYQRQYEPNVFIGAGYFTRRRPLGDGQDIDTGVVEQLAEFRTEGVR